MTASPFRGPVNPLIPTDIKRRTIVRRYFVVLDAKRSCDRFGK